MASPIEQLRDEFSSRVVALTPDTQTLNWDSSALTQFRHMHGLGLPEAGLILRPSTVDEAADVIRRACRLLVPITARGGGSGVVEGIMPHPGEILLHLAQLDHIGSLDPTNGHVTVEAGVNGWALEQHLNESGWTLGHWPQSIQLATVGGLIATKSIGQFSTRYGGIEQMVSQLDVVTGTGNRIHVGHLSPRRTLGPELLPLFMGSEGTLGVILRAVLKVQPLPRSQEGLSLTAAEFGDGLEIIRRWLHHDLIPSMVRLYDAGESARTFPAARGRTVLLALFHGYPDEVQRNLARATELAQFEAELSDPAYIDHWLKTRNDVVAWRPLLQQGILADTLEISAPWDRLADLHRVIVGQVSELSGVLGVTAHLSHAYRDGANLYFTFLASPSRIEEAPHLYRQIISAILDLTLAGGGSTAHHHGVGRLRREWLQRERAEEMPYLRAIKQVFDPDHLLNRGALWNPPANLSRNNGGDNSIV